MAVVTQQKIIRAGYKQTEIGLIPEDWQVKRLGEVFQFLKTASNSRSDLSESGEVKYLHYGDIHMRPGCFLDCEHDELPSIEASKVHDVPFLKDGDLVMADASEDYEGLGKSVEIRNTTGRHVVAGLHTLLLRSDKDSLVDGFKAYLQFIPAVRRALIRIATGISVYGISKTNIRNIEVGLPKVKEQSAIASTLSDANTLIAALDQLIAKKRNLKTAAMQQLLTGKRRLPGFSGQWEVLSIAEESTLKARIGWQGLTTAEYLPTGEYYLVTGTDLVCGRVNWASCCFVPAERYLLDQNIQLQARDILLTKDGTIGKVAFVESLPGPATLNSGVFVIRPRGNAYDPLFFYYILTSRVFADFLAQLQAGSTISHLYQKDFVNFRFRAPCLAEQTAIANVLSDIDAELDALEARREKVRALKQGMMQQLLTGSIRLV